MERFLAVPDWVHSMGRTGGVVTSASSPAVAAINKVDFPKSKMSDKHIQDILRYVAADTHRTVMELESEIRANMDKFSTTTLHKAPLLYGTMFQNFIEDAAIHMFQETKLGLVATAPKFSPSMFSQLRRKVKMEHSPGLFPLKNKIDRLPLAKEEYVLVPSSRKEDSHYNSTKTASASSTGTFVFNVHYCQKLLEYAHVKGVIPKGKKYKNNGGMFPPEWCYIEFLLIHEWMHYRQADWHYMKIFKDDTGGKLTNWVGDFRSNYELVKGGLPVIPGLLYNKDVNYDTQGTMREMYEIVRAEFDKLSEAEKNEVKEHLDKNSDDHAKDQKPPQEQAPKDHEQQDMGEGGKQDEQADDGKPDSGKPSQSKPGKPGKNGPKPGEHEGKEGEEKKGAQEKNEPAGSEGPSEKEMEEEGREAKDSLSKGMEKGEEADVDAKGKADELRRQMEEEARRKREGQQIKHSAVDYSKERPTYDWEQLTKQFVKNALGGTEESYAKLNRRDLPQMVDQLDREGTARVKPAEIDVEGKLKLVVVVDTSASMQSVLGKVYANLKALLGNSGSKAAVSDNFYILRFSDNYELFAGSLKTGVAQELDISKLEPKAKAGVTMDWLFSTAESGATEFTAGLVSVIEKLILAKNNVLIVTDSDCLYDPNLTHFSELIKRHMDKVFVLLSGRWEYEQARRLLKIKPPNLSYFK